MCATAKPRKTLVTVVKGNTIFKKTTVNNLFYFPVAYCTRQVSYMQQYLASTGVLGKEAVLLVVYGDIWKNC
jgi:hypothetical protein